MAIKLDELSDLLLNVPNLDTKIRADIVKRANELERDKKEEKAETAGGPKLKNEFIILVRGTPELAKELQQGWVVQVKQDDDTNTLVDRMKTAAKEQNEGAKKPKWRIHTWADLFMNLKRKFSKGQNFQPKVKSPVRVIVLENEYINE